MIGGVGNEQVAEKWGFQKVTELRAKTFRSKMPATAFF